MTKERLNEIKDTQKSIRIMIQQADAIPDLKQRYCWLAIVESMQEELIKELEVALKNLN